MIEQVAVEHGITPAELVRVRTLALAERRLLDPPAASLSPGHIALIETTWRAVHLLATLATRNMPYQEIDKLVSAAHNAMRETMNSDPDRAVPGKAPTADRQQRHDEARPVPDGSPGYRRL